MAAIELHAGYRDGCLLYTNNSYKEKELDSKATVKESFTVQTEGNRQVTRKLEYYNTDAIDNLRYTILLNPYIK